MSLIQKLKNKLVDRKVNAEQTAEQLALDTYHGKEWEPAKAEEVLRDAGLDVTWPENRVGWLKTRKELQDQINAGEVAKVELKKIGDTISKSHVKLVAEEQRHAGVVAEHVEAQRNLNHTIILAGVAERKLSGMPDAELKGQAERLGQHIAGINKRFIEARRQHQPPDRIRVLQAQRQEIAEQRESLQKKMLEVA